MGIGSSSAVRAEVARTSWWSSPRRVALLTVLAVAASVVAALTATDWNSQFDLRIYYNAVGFWQAGHDLYAYAQPDPVMGSLGFTYPPVAALAMTPMTWFSFGLVRIITMAAIVVAGGLLIYLIVWDSGSVPRRALLPITLVSTPLAFMIESMRENLSFGQVNVFLGLLVAADFLFVARRAPKAFGIATGFATALKLTPGVFLLYLALTRRWRALGNALLTAAVLTGLAAAAMPKDSWDFFTSLLWDTARVGRPENLLNQSVNGYLYRIFAPDPAPRALWAVLVAAVLVVGLRRARRLYFAGDDLAGMSVVGLVGFCVSPISWIHHAVWVLPALAVLADGWWRLRADPTARARRAGIAALAVSGAAIWAMRPTSYLKVPIGDWSLAPPFAVMVSGLPLLWCLAVIAFLPARQPVLPADGLVPAASGFGRRST